MEIYVYGDWIELKGCQFIGTLYAEAGKGRKSFRFEYDKSWLVSHAAALLIDPDLMHFSGPLYPSNGKENFGIILDSMPDRWGRTLLQRREALLARAANRKVKKLYDIDFLLGIYDAGRMGALRFKLDKNGPFLNADHDTPIPSWASIRELQYSAQLIESDHDSIPLQKHLAMLIAPGSSLGGARPKSNVLDDHKHPWIAKFPSKNDTIDKAAWEYLAYQLAVALGINMATCKIEKVKGPHHTFFTKRFDRQGSQRIHFASAMTMINLDENAVRDDVPSYLDLVEFIEYNTYDPAHNLEQLWKRIVFHICISNTDDHLRNHGFLLDQQGWRLSPAFDINPSVEKAGLALNIDENSNELNLDLAIEVGEYFRLNMQKMDRIIKKTLAVVRSWRAIATRIGISNREQELMAPAFMT